MEQFLELSKTWAPVALAYVALLRHRVDLDIVAARQRGGPQFLRRRWYSFVKRKSIKAFEENYAREVGE